MSAQTAIEQSIFEITRTDPRFRAAAYHLVFEALDFTMLRLGKSKRRGSERHLTVTELLEGFRDHAIAQFGPLSRIVLSSVGIESTDDVGEVVFRLVERGLLNKQDSDTRDQFAHAFSFREAFDEKRLARLAR